MAEFPEVLLDRLEPGFRDEVNIKLAQCEDNAASSGASGLGRSLGTT